MSRTLHHTKRFADAVMVWDRKGFGKFKKMARRLRKAKERQAIKNKNYEFIPHFKRTDMWDFL